MPSAEDDSIAIYSLSGKLRCGTVMGSKDEIASEIEAAIEAGEKFVKIYYETFEKKRHMINKLYQDNAKLVWEGNPVVGKNDIQKFIQDLPSCYHTVDSFDCQPVLSRFTKGQTTCMVVVTGTVKYDSNTLKLFTQDFTISSVGDVWKILSDCLRLQDV